MNYRNYLVVLTLLFAIIISWQIRWVLLILFSSITVAVAMDVLINQINSKIKFPRLISLSLVLLILLLVASVIFQLLIPELNQQIVEFSKLLPELIEKVKQILSKQTYLIGIQDSIPETIRWESIQTISPRLLGVAGGAANRLIQILLIILLSILLVFDPKSHREIVVAATPRKYREEINQLLDEFRIALGGWITGMTISAFTVFAMTWIGLSLLKVPLALLSALTCGILTFLPTLGPTLATTLPLGISLIISPTLMFEVLILRISLQSIEAFVLTPLLLKRTVNLLPTVALMSQLVLGAILGLPGLIIALPLAVVIQVGLQRILVMRVMDNWI